MAATAGLLLRRLHLSGARRVGLTTRALSGSSCHPRGAAALRVVCGRCVRPLLSPRLPVSCASRSLSLPRSCGAPNAQVMKHHQKEGVKWLWDAYTRGGGLLTDDPGLGKTLQVVALIEALVRMDRPIARILIACPANMCARACTLPLMPAAALSLAPRPHPHLIRHVPVPRRSVANWHAEFARWLPRRATRRPRCHPPVRMRLGRCAWRATGFASGQGRIEC